VIPIDASMLTPRSALRQAYRISPSMVTHTQVELARRLGYTAKHVSEVLHDKAPISVDMALRLERVLWMPMEDWLLLQNRFDLD
jgi:addiction module HigA family antidote